MIEPFPSVEEMQCVHAGHYETDDVLERLWELLEADKQLERDHDEGLARHQ